MFRESLRYPFRGRHRLDVVLVGGGLHLLAVWVPVLPLIVVLGYLQRVLARTSQGRGVDSALAEPPGFNDPLGLLVDGVRAGLVTIAYLAAPVVLLAMAAGGTLDLGPGAGPVPPGVALGFLVASTATLFLALAIASLLPVALANCARERSVRAAFDGTLLRRAITDGGYLTRVTFGWTVLALGASAMGPLNAVALGFFVAFYAEVVCVTQWGRAAARVLPSRVMNPVSQNWKNKK